jgi:lipoprotein-anchoring transpeptidase ErfK/SrfK
MQLVSRGVAMSKSCTSLVFGVALSSLVVSVTVPAMAQTYNDPENRQMASAVPPGSYGGGFLEFLLSGGRSAAYNSPASHPAAAAYRAAAQPGEPQRTVNPIFERQQVDYSGPGRPGTIVIDTKDKFLFLVEKGNKALRYGVGVGREGFAWSGVEKISRKAEWPDWTPPSEMLKRRPDLPTHMAGGIENPLGARALYLGHSLYRIHGTNEPYSIGTNVSSGCIRMMNEDVIDLYNRVGVGTKVIVM